MSCAWCRVSLLGFLQPSPFSPAGSTILCAARIYLCMYLSGWPERYFLLILISRLEGKKFATGCQKPGVESMLHPKKLHHEEIQDAGLDTKHFVFYSSITSFAFNTPPLCPCTSFAQKLPPKTRSVFSALNNNKKKNNSQQGKALKYLAALSQTKEKKKRKQATKKTYERCQKFLSCHGNGGESAAVDRVSIKQSRAHHSAM